MISLSVEYSRVTVGPNIEKAQVPQFIIPGGTWFAVNVINANDHSLVRCTVSPGFDFADFELANREQLLEMFPQHHKVIRQFCQQT